MVSKRFLLLAVPLFLSGCTSGSQVTSSSQNIALEQDPYERFQTIAPENRLDKNETVRVKKSSQKGKDFNILPEVDPLKAQGDLTVVGSATVLPLTEVIYENYVADGYRDTINLYGNGSGSGFKLFCQPNGPDITNASRAAKDSEKEACKQAGRELLEFRVGTDAIAVVVHTSNTFLRNVSKEELAAIFRAENWSDVNPDWPDEKIKRFSPDSDSGTFDFFVDEIFDGNSAPLLNGLDNEFSADPNDLVLGVSSNPYAISFFGYSFYQAQAGSLKLISVEDVLPKASTLDDYLLARPLFFYSDAKTLRQKSQVADFVNYYLSQVQQEIGNVGYFPVSDQNLIQSQTLYMNSLGFGLKEE